MDLKTLQKDIDSGTRKPAYLLHGEERYLVAHYADALSAGFDRDTFEGSAPANAIMLAAGAFPFFAEKRAVIVRDSKLFAAGRKADSEALADYLPQIPSETVLIFVETDVDKRLKLYKRVAEIGRAADCAPLTPADLSRWVTQKFRARQKTISPEAAQMLMRATAHAMTALTAEIDKLSAYVGARPSVTAEDIAALTTPTLQTRIFDLLAAMGRGDTARALALYANMLYMKESPHMILTMLIRQFRILLQCKCAQEKKMPKSDMAKAFGLRTFMLDEALAQARRYPTDKLLSALTDCLDTDVRMKTGRLDAEVGVELLVIKYSFA